MQGDAGRGGTRSLDRMAVICSDYVNRRMFLFCLACEAQLLNVFCSFWTSRIVLRDLTAKCLQVKKEPGTNKMVGYGGDKLNKRSAGVRLVDIL